MGDKLNTWQQVLDERVDSNRLNSISKELGYTIKADTILRGDGLRSVVFDLRKTLADSGYKRNCLSEDEDIAKMFPPNETPQISNGELLSFYSNDITRRLQWKGFGKRRFEIIGVYVGEIMDRYSKCID